MLLISDVRDWAFHTNMKDLAETAHKANSDAYEVVTRRVKESVAELKALAETSKG